MSNSITDAKLDDFFQALDHQGLLPLKKRHNLQYYLNHYLLQSVEIPGKHVLEIGAGAGMYSFYIACLGAKRVVSLEPEADGSTSGVIQQYQSLLSQLSLSNETHLETSNFQDYETDETFNVILLYNTVNHLDEEACIHLQTNTQSRQHYLHFFKRLHTLTANQGSIVIADCSRHNFFAKIHQKNPFAPTIEWEKHQSPAVWVELLAEVGFHKPVIRWRGWRAYGLRKFGVALFGNYLAAYFLDSHFCLTMQKK